MNIIEILKKLGSKIGQNIDNSAEKQRVYVAQGKDRLERMLNPNKAGPELPPTTPEEQEYYEDLSTSVVGSLAPVANIPKMMVDGQKVNAAKGILDQAKTLSEATKAQTVLNRELHYADRAKAQRFAKLKGLMGK